MRPLPIFDNPNYRGSGKLKDKIAIITGGDSGLGRACSIAFVKEGAKVVIPYYNETRDANDTKEYIERLGGECLLIKGDITDHDFCKEIVKKTIDKFDVDEKPIKQLDKIIIGKYSDAPDYLKDNEYIKNGYLINCHSLKLVLRSLFVCSNETINIWSHLLGCIISILLIVLTVMFLKTSLIRELSQTEYEDLQVKVNETIIPWSSELRRHKLSEIGKINSNVCSVIDNILSNTDNLVSNYGTKFTTITIIENFIENTKKLINKIVNIFSSDSNILDDITTKWEICVNKIISYIKYDMDDIIKIKGENIGRWPLFIMLSAAIVCFGFSTSFHWFSIYSKNLYSLLCRLDYAGITFLIPGSCYPPYFYFYYCERCK